MTRIFYAKIDTKIIMGELYGYNKNAEYLDAVFDDMIRSIKRE